RRRGRDHGAGRRPDRPGRPGGPARLGRNEGARVRHSLIVAVFIGLAAGGCDTEGTPRTGAGDPTVADSVAVSAGTSDTGLGVDEVESPPRGEAPAPGDERAPEPTPITTSDWSHGIAERKSES